MAEPTLAVGADARETLKVLALEGALADRAHVSCGGLADRLGVSTQTASRRLQELDEAGLVDREMVSDGQYVTTTDAGRAELEREYADYRRLFEELTGVDLHGTVTAGMGEGRHYISLPGYMEQFRERLGYEPFPGTLNVELDESSVRARAGLDAVDPVRIEGWEDDERTYGPAFCWPATLETDAGTYDPVHVIAPERTHHGQDKVELIAPDRLRDELDLADGEQVTVHVEED
ncbi:CTP-dependent riboflavin kinase [Halomarina litorea]|uniref:CTP-dependent riboflavin kinase n=1 Tax=Halomarina litorea TaxID=2961595 RepID=UPI0020C405F1|nr:CTP-dependent riboflavin kinase [Halomarina sp. BCD28]